MIKAEAIDAVARAMAEEMKIGDEPVPERDVVRHHHDARRLIAGMLALQELKPDDVVDRPEYAEASPALDHEQPRTDIESEQGIG